MATEILITGGAGFIGCNLADRLLSAGATITIFDDLSRVGVKNNINWLQQKHGYSSFRMIKADIRDFEAVREAVRGQAIVYHLAGQVAVTTSVQAPRQDFEINALGSLNILEAARKYGDNPILIYASTNKVYGGMEDVKIDESETKYLYHDFPEGIDESCLLDFHSPYGCSKGSGDQYFRDYQRIYGLRTVVFRQSCIYGPRQMGVEDQGWIAWFIIAAVLDKTITIYGNGKQVRDVLFITDLLDAYQSAIDQIDTAAGQIYNIGGGPKNALSIWTDLGPMLHELLGKEIKVQYKNWRPGDQLIYISNNRKLYDQLGWQPRTAIREA